MITIKRINKVNLPDVKAFFDATVNGITIYGLKLISNKQDGKFFVSFPSEKSTQGKYFHSVYIEDILLKEELTNKLVEAYNKT